MTLTLPDTSQEQDLVATCLMEKYMAKWKQIKGKVSPKLLMFTSYTKIFTLDKLFGFFFSLVAV